MTATVTERPGSKAETKFVRMSASKARVVLNLIRGKKVSEAQEILFLCDRLAAEPVKKCLDSAIANASHNEDISPDDLYVSACYSDEGPTIKRFRPRARGRASRIHKQVCHIKIEVARYTDEELKDMRDAAASKAKSSEGKASKTKKKSSRADRVAKSKAKETPAAADVEEIPPTPAEAEAAEAVADEEVETPPTPDEVEAVDETADEVDEEVETPPTPDEAQAQDAEAEVEEEVDTEPEVEEDEKEGEA